jgi:hypothetical protein
LGVLIAASLSEICSKPDAYYITHCVPKTLLGASVGVAFAVSCVAWGGSGEKTGGLGEGERQIVIS